MDMREQATGRVRWTPAHVSSAVGPELIARTYTEQQEIRQILGRWVPRPDAPSWACELGAGYGRLTPVLAEFAGRVIAYEAEPDMAELGARLYPSIEFAPLDDFCDANMFRLVMTFTFLQHLTEYHARTLCGVIADGARFALLAEETNTQLSALHADGRTTQGRSVEQYKEWMAPMRLAHLYARHYDRPSPAGHHPMYLLFAR